MKAWQGKCLFKVKKLVSKLLPSIPVKKRLDKAKNTTDDFRAAGEIFQKMDMYSLLQDAEGTFLAPISNIIHENIIGLIEPNNTEYFQRQQNILE